MNHVGYQVDISIYEYEEKIKRENRYKILEGYKSPHHTDSKRLRSSYTKN